MPLLTPVLWLIAALLSAALVWWRAMPQPPQPVALVQGLMVAGKPVPVVGVPCLAPVMAQDLPLAGRRQHHAASLLPLPDGRLASYWFAGTREGAADVAILRAEFDGRNWSPAEPVLQADQLGRQLGRAVRKLGNPVAWFDAQGRTHLVVVHVTLGGWAMARLAHLSSDDGRHFGSANDWVLGPFWNFSTLVRHAPLMLADGTAWLPVYHELALKRPELVLLDADGQLLQHRRMAGGRHLLQPALAAGADGRELISLSRSGDEQSRHVHQQVSRDGGLSWSAPEALDLPNPDASIALAAWPQRRGWLLVYNPETHTRRRLALAWRAWDDPAGRWQPLPVELAESAEASYPSLQIRGDEVDLLYTRDRASITHRRWRGCDLLKD